MEEMAVVDSETFQREHEPLSTNLVLLVVILVLFHVGAIGYWMYRLYAMSSVPRISYFTKTLGATKQF